ncbi:hypothetical protein A6E01_20840 (plasmid) [Vibrio breoganii]|uniref:Uncharacterized protein n=1 Tax=Vibrio breoganii TaxID=553239 RepID=A0AAN1CUE3_9VIBR|nr:hypothetical protein A6E01_20840 [Vibrio breoganii]
MAIFKEFPPGNGPYLAIDRMPLTLSATKLLRQVAIHHTHRTLELLMYKARQIISAFQNHESFHLGDLSYDELCLILQCIKELKN